MSTASSTPPHPSPIAVPADREVRVYSHSPMLYWWPVWATGFVMAFITYLDGHYLAIVPPGTVAYRDANVEATEPNGTQVHVPNRDVLVLEKDKHLMPDKAEEKDQALPAPIKPHYHMAQNKNLGALFMTVLLLIIVVSNVPLRGLWSVLILLFIFLMSVIFALLTHQGRTIWDWIFEYLQYLVIYINAGGYVFLSLVLLILWLLTVFVFDRRTYLIVAAGQVRLCLAVGAGETVYDTTGMTFEKRQDDLFRHRIIGIGSGDLIIHRANSPKDIELPNVAFIHSKIKDIEKLMKEREVV